MEFLIFLTPFLVSDCIISIAHSKKNDIEVKLLLLHLSNSNSYRLMFKSAAIFWYCTNRRLWILLSVFSFMAKFLLFSPYLAKSLPFSLSSENLLLFSSFLEKLFHRASSRSPISKYRRYLKLFLRNQGRIVGRILRITSCSLI